MSYRPSPLCFLIVLVTLLAVLHETHLLCSNIFANAEIEVLFKQCSSGDLAKMVEEDTCIAVPTEFPSCGVRPKDDSRYKCRAFNDVLCKDPQDSGPYFICESL